MSFGGFGGLSFGGSSEPPPEGSGFGFNAASNNNSGNNNNEIKLDFSNFGGPQKSIWDQPPEQKETLK
eukprot:UN02569